MKTMVFGILCVFTLLLSSGCGGTVTPGDDSANGVQTVQAGYEVTGTSAAATVMIADNASNTTLYFTETSVPWSRSEEEEDSNYVFPTVMYNDVLPETLSATIFVDGEVFQSSTSPLSNDINFTIEGFLDQ